MSKTLRTAPASPDCLRTAEQVCWLPLLDPAVQFSLLTAFSLRRGDTWPVANVDFLGCHGGLSVSVSYHVDLQRRMHPLSGAGHWGGRPVQGRGTVSSDRRHIHLQESIGRTRTTFDLTLHAAAGTMLLRGQAGPLDIELGFQTRLQGSRLVGFVCDGRLGLDQYRVETDLLCSEQPDKHLEGRLEAHGCVGPHAMRRSYAMTSLQPSSGHEILWAGEGLVGDCTHQTLVTLTLLP